MAAKKIEKQDIVRSSAAEYLTFIAAHGEGGVEAVYADENIWLTQKMMGVLYRVETHTVNYHLKKIFADSELQEEAVIRNFRITASDGKTYNTKHYNLSAIIAVGYKVNSERAVQFRKWATAFRSSQCSPDNSGSQFSVEARFIATYKFIKLKNPPNIFSKYYQVAK